MRRSSAPGMRIADECAAMNEDQMFTIILQEQVQKEK